MDEIKISTPFIKLDQLLKFAGVVNEGADAKLLIQGGFVKVNGVTDTQRGKKMYPGDECLIEFENEKIGIKVI